MAKRIRFTSGTNKPRKAANTSFNFGLNVMTPKQQRSYRKKASGKGGGS